MNKIKLSSKNPPIINENSYEVTSGTTIENDINRFLSFNKDASYYEKRQQKVEEITYVFKQN